MSERPGIIFSPPDITEKEIEEVADALRSGWITTGPKTKELERRLASYCRTKRVVCLNSSTASMEMTLRLFGIGPGDEIITTAYTYTATASAICHTGATPVLIDLAENSYEMDYDAVERAVTARTKAIVPVDIAGIMCDYDRVIEIAEKKRDLFTPSDDNSYQKALGRILVMADSAHGLGAKRHGKMSGQMADFTTFSFHAVKNLTTAEGGAVTWRELPGVDSEEIYKEFMLLSLHGQSKDALAKTKLGGWEYDILYPAYKCNMTDVSAAIGLVQLERYSGLLKRRREIISRYEEGLAYINRNPSVRFHLSSVEHYNDVVTSSGHLFLMRLQGASEEQRNFVIEKMAERGVPTNVHYKPLPMMTAYKNLGFDIKNFPNAYDMYKNEITLPLHTKLSDSDLSFILDVLEEVLVQLDNGRQGE